MEDARKLSEVPARTAAKMGNARYSLLLGDFGDPAFEIGVLIASLLIVDFEPFSERALTCVLPANCNDL